MKIYLKPWFGPEGPARCVPRPQQRIWLSYWRGCSRWWGLSNDKKDDRAPAPPILIIPKLRYPPAKLQDAEQPLPGLRMSLASHPQEIFSKTFWKHVTQQGATQCHTTTRYTHNNKDCNVWDKNSVDNGIGWQWYQLVLDRLAEESVGRRVTRAGKKVSQHCRWRPRLACDPGHTGTQIVHTVLDAWLPNRIMPCTSRCGVTNTWTNSEHFHLQRCLKYSWAQY